jgi:hypothetical protein
MAKAVLRVLKEDALHKRMSEAGPRWTAEKFSRERMVEDYFRFFEGCIGQRAGGREDSAKSREQEDNRKEHGA